MPENAAAPRLGLFGGTFDPPHISHVLAVHWALCTGEIDRVLLIPTARHAFGKEPQAGFADRLEMCRRAVAHLQLGLVEVTDIEGRRSGTSYMVDTVRELYREYPGATFRLLIGTDIVPDLPKWRESETLLSLAPVLEVPRISESTRNDQLLGALPMLSSTEVRRRLAAAEDVRELVPVAVRQWIGERGLYGVSGVRQDD